MGITKLLIARCKNLTTANKEERRTTDLKIPSKYYERHRLLREKYIIELGT